MTKCDVCKKPFKNSHGVSIHKMRTPACGGTSVNWGPKTAKKSTTRKPRGRRPTGPNGESGKEAIHEILADHPQGLGTTEIRTEMQARGFLMNPNYISQAAAHDPSIVRVERGRYRLKSNAAKRIQTQGRAERTGTAVVKEAVSEAKVEAGITLPRETLLLRIETLESQNRALLDAHMSLIRGVFA